MAKGDFLFFVDSDDYLMPGAVAKLFNAVSPYPDCHLAMGQYVQQPNTLPGYEQTGLILGGDDHQADVFGTETLPSCMEQTGKA